MRLFINHDMINLEVVPFNAFGTEGFSSCWRKLPERSWGQGSQERLKWALSIGVHVSLHGVLARWL